MYRNYLYAYNKPKFHSSMTEVCHYNAWRDPPLLKRYFLTYCFIPAFYTLHRSSRHVWSENLDGF